MTLDAQHLTGTLVSSAAVLIVMYRRFRRNFGKQKLRPGWMIFRIVLLAVIGLFIIGLRLADPMLLVVTAGGLAIGIGLGVWGASRTRFLKENDKLYYIPHTYTGLVVTALFVGRIIYKFIAVTPLMNAAGQTETDAMPSWDDIQTYLAYVNNPITRLIFFILIGYYVYYFTRVLWESHHLKPEDWEKSNSPITRA